MRNPPFSGNYMKPGLHKLQLATPVLILQQLLRAGFFNVVKLMNSTDLSFLKASLDQETRDWLKDLLHEYNRFFKFSGKV